MPMPEMQNPGVPGVFTREQIVACKGRSVTLIPIPAAGILIEFAFPPRISRWSKISQADEDAARADTTIE